MHEKLIEIPGVRSVETVGLDLDHTLYPRSEKMDMAIAECLGRKIAGHLGVTGKQATYMFRDAYSRLESSTKAFCELGISDGDKLLDAAVDEADVTQFIEPSPETVEFLKDLSSRVISMDLITGSTMASTREKLKKIGIPLDLFGWIIGAEDGRKIDGGAYKLWLSKYLCLRPENFLYFGDRPSVDAEVPQSLGIKAVLVNNPKIEDGISVVQLPSLFDIKKTTLWQAQNVLSQ